MAGPRQGVGVQIKHQLGEKGKVTENRSLHGSVLGFL